MRYLAPAMNPSTLDYAVPRREPFSIWRAFIWLAPLWAAAIIGLHLIFGGGDDPYWWVAIGFTALLGVVCLVQRRRGLALYCLGTLVLLFAVAVLLPSLNRAR